MKRVISFFILAILLSACNKDEKNFLLWDISPGPGEAYNINTLSDSGFYACGRLNGSPWFVVYDRERRQVFDIQTAGNGLFSSAWIDTGTYILAGSEAGRMLLQRYNRDGTIVWQKTIDGLFNVDITDLFNAGNGNMLATGSAEADSLGTGDSGILFLKFDTSGNIITRKDVTVTGYVSARADYDAQGNIFLALTKQSAGSKPHAAAAKYSPDFNLLWETDLFNNPGFSSASLSIKRSGDRILVAGRTEVPSNSGTVLNSFLVSLDNNGNLSSGWSKKYPESGNEGSALTVDKDNNIIMLNRRCMLLSRLNANDGSNMAVSRTFDVCDAGNTDIFGNDLEVMSDGNILLAGTVGGKFFVSMKSPQ